ncbi:MAG: quinol:cytochrome C oxidoreductase, partial [Ginsengibacter sp.]
MNNQYEITAGYKRWSIGLMIAGLLTLILGVIFLNPFAGADGTNANSTRFWAVMLQNCLFWLMLVNVATFFIAINTLAMSGWQEAFRRVTEAVSTLVPILGGISFLILLCIVFGNRSDIYPWLDKNVMAHDHVMHGKKGFLNPTVFLAYSLVALFLWSYWGKKLRNLSQQSDETGTMDLATSKRWMKKNMGISAAYVVFYILTIGSFIPWLWLMSIDAKWFSTMYSWYTFGSTFVAGIALLTLFVIYFKNQGLLEFVNKEHIQDLGK